PAFSTEKGELNETLAPLAEIPTAPLLGSWNVAGPVKLTLAPPPTSIVDPLGTVMELLPSVNVTLPPLADTFKVEPEGRASELPPAYKVVLPPLTVKLLLLRTVVGAPGLTEVFICTPPVLVTLMLPSTCKEPLVPLAFRMRVPLFTSKLLALLNSRSPD